MDERINLTDMVCYGILCVIVTIIICVIGFML